MLVVIPKITGIPSMLEKTRISGRALKSFRDTKDIKENNNIRDTKDIRNTKYFNLRIPSISWISRISRISNLSGILLNLPKHFQVLKL